MNFKLLKSLTVGNSIYSKGMIGTIPLKTILLATTFPFFPFKVGKDEIQVKPQWIEYVSSDDPSEMDFLLNFSRAIESHKYIVFYSNQNIYGFRFETEQHLPNRPLGPKELMLRKAFEKLALDIADECKTRVCIIGEGSNKCSLAILEKGKTILNRDFPNIESAEAYIGMHDGEETI